MEGKEKVEKILEGLSKTQISEDDSMKGIEDDNAVADGSDIWEELDRQFG